MIKKSYFSKVVCCAAAMTLLSGSSITKYPAVAAEMNYRNAEIPPRMQPNTILYYINDRYQELHLAKSRCLFSTFAEFFDIQNSGHKSLQRLSCIVSSTHRNLEGDASAGTEIHIKRRSTHLKTQT